MHLIPKLPTNERVKHFKNCLLHHLYHLNGYLRHKIWCQRCFQCIYNVYILSKYCRFVIDLSTFWLGLFLIVRRRTYTWLIRNTLNTRMTDGETVSEPLTCTMQTHIFHINHEFCPRGNYDDTRWPVYWRTIIVLCSIDIGTDDTLTVKPEVMTYTLCACVSNWKSDRSYNDKYNNTPV